MIFAADFAADADGTMGGFLALEVVAVIQLDLVDTGKAPHKVQMPIAAAEFAIDDGVVAARFCFSMSRVICSFSTAVSCSRVISPALNSARAVLIACGRRKLPTKS